MNFENIKYIVIDVDGTMTDGGIYYDNNGNELKKFNTRDAIGFFAFHNVGIKVIVITGRKSDAVDKRMKEMKVDFLFQNVTDKKTFLKAFIDKNNIKKCELAYIGDDMNDYFAAKNFAGYIACPKDACKEMKSISNYVSKELGGNGVIRDVAENLLSHDGYWMKLMEKLFL